MPEPLTPEKRRDLIRCAEQWCDGQLDAPVSRIGVGRETFRWEATVAAAEQEVARLRELVKGLVTHAEIAVNSSEWYGPADRTRAESLVEAAKAHLRGGADPTAGGGS